MKKNQVRKMLAVTALAGILVLSAGCGSNAGSAGASSADSAAAQTESAAGSESEEIEAASAAEESAVSEAEEESSAAESAGSEAEEASSAAESGSSEEEMTGLANPWSETQDPEEAAAGAGVRLEAPMEGLPKHGDATMNFWKYLWMDGIMEARYESVNDEMMIRASVDYAEQDLSGDYTEYSQSWEESFKGLEVKCMGDGETVNLAYFDEGDTHVSISYNAGEEGRGLTVEELSSLVMGLYAEPAGTTE